MASTTYLSDPAKTTSLDSFINAGEKITFKYANFCFRDEMSNGTVACIHNVLDDYADEIDQFVEEVELNMNEIHKYRYNPKRLAYDVYKSTDMYSFVLYINGMSNVKEFNLSSGKVKLIHKDTFPKILSEILSAENKSLDIYNYK